MIEPARPTSYPQINALLQTLLEQVQATLGSQFVGMYLEGSLTGDDFDRDSDVDFVVATDEPVSGEHFLALQALHDRIATLDSPWAIQLEGSYVPRLALRRYDPAHALHPNIERGLGERLKLAKHDASWVIHLSILRERGITLAGPAPNTLIDPVGPEQLRQAMLAVLRSWAAPLLANPARIQGRGYQSYIVLSLCRILYTLEHGTIASKRVAARWAQASLGPAWAYVIERAWEGRHDPGSAASQEDLSATLALIRFVLGRSQPDEPASTA